MSSELTVILGICIVGVGIGLGCATTLNDFKIAFQNPKAVFIGLGSQFVYMPLICFSMAKIFGMTDYQSVGCILVGCCPGGTTSNLFTYWCHGNVALSITMSFLSTLVALGMLPLLMYIYIDLALDIGGLKMPWANIFISLVMITLPTCLGLLIRHQNTAYKIKGHFVYYWIEKSMSALGVVFVFVALAFAVVTEHEAIFSGTWSAWVASSLIQPMGFIFGYVTSYLFGLHRPDCRTVCLETGVQNITLALALVAISFKGKDKDKIIVFVYIYGFMYFIHAFYIVPILRWLMAPFDSEDEMKERKCLDVSAHEVHEYVFDPDAAPPAAQQQDDKEISYQKVENGNDVILVIDDQQNKVMASMCVDTNQGNA